MRLTVLVLILCVFSCQNLDQGDKKTHDQQSVFSSRPFIELLRESKAVLAVKDYLLSEGYEIDSLYAYEITYSDSLYNEPRDSLFIPPDPIKARFASFIIEHKVNHDYYDWIQKENNRRIKESKNKDEWIPIIIPSTPGFLKKSILLHYYFEEDSVVSEDVPW